MPLKSIFKWHLNLSGVGATGPEYSINKYHRLHSPDEILYVLRIDAISVSMRQEYLSSLSDRVSIIFGQQRQMATAGVFDIELNEDGVNDSDHSDEEPIKPASEEHVQVMIVASLSLMSASALWGHLLGHFYVSLRPKSQYLV